MGSRNSFMTRIMSQNRHCHRLASCKNYLYYLNQCSTVQDDQTLNF